MYASGDQIRQPEAAPAAMHGGPQLHPGPGLHFAAVIHSLGVGGAERVMADVAATVAHAGGKARLFLLERRFPELGIGTAAGLTIVPLWPAGPTRSRFDRLAEHAAGLGLPFLYTSALAWPALQELWRRGIATVPVVWNDPRTWPFSPSRLPARLTPFIAASSMQARAQLLAAGCRLPIRVLRHELGGPATENAAAVRKRLRQDHGVASRRFLVGMIGHFKLHKAYTRAVRVLAELRKEIDARLMIIGGWDQPFGAGSEAHAAVCRLALELGVTEHLIMPGLVRDAARLIPAFDAFLNTSLYEGISVATMEARHCGCPVVSADAGGQAEAMGPDDYLVPQEAAPSAYAAALCEIARRPRRRQTGPERASMAGVEAALTWARLQAQEGPPGAGADQGEN